MKFLELENPSSRFRFAQSCLGLTGCLCVCYAVCTPYWFEDKGLWAQWNNSNSDQTNYEEDSVFSVLEAERVFGVVSLFMALATGALCLVIALCWTSTTVLSYANTYSLLMSGQALYPTTLLLVTMASTGFFFFLSWSFFTYQHLEEIRQDFSSLGSSYWLGALGWALLLVVETVVFIGEQMVVPDIMPDLKRVVGSLRTTSPSDGAKRSHSVGYQAAVSKSKMAPKRVFSAP